MNYRVYVIAIENTPSAFDHVMIHVNSWAEITDEDAVDFDKAEQMVGDLENGYWKVCEA